MRLAFYTYSYTDRLKIKIPTCLERVSKTGYSGIDVSGTNGKSSDPNSFDQQRRSLTRKTAEKFGLKLEAVITHAQLTDSLSNPNSKPLDLKGSIDLAAEIRADVVTFHMGGYHESVPKDKLWRQVVDVIRAAADYGAAKHVRLAVDGIWPTWIDDSPKSLEKIFDDVDHMNFGVNFDPCYLTLMEVDPVRFVKRFRTRIFHAHLKDHKGKYPKWTHLIPGQGEMNYGPVFRSLANIKFDGAVAVECFTDMKFESACDDGFSAMTKAARSSRVTFKKK